MSDSLDEDIQSVIGDLDFDLLKDLERQNLEQIKQLRAHERLEVKIGVYARPGNSSASDQSANSGVTCDLSAGGCMAVFERPIGVGDVYRLEFEKGALDLPMVFARCRRCRLIREDAFEAGFSFFSQIQLKAERTEDDLLA